MDSHYLTTRHRSRKSSADGSVTPSFEVENSFAAQMAQYSDNEAATDEKDAMLFSSTSADASPLRRSSGPLDSRAGRRWMRVAVLAAVLAVVTLFRHTWWNAPAYAKAIVPTETLKGDGTRWVVLTTMCRRLLFFMPSCSSRAQQLSHRLRTYPRRHQLPQRRRRRRYKDAQGLVITGRALPQRRATACNQLQGALCLHIRAACSVA